MANLLVEDVLRQRNNYNLAIPFVETQQINPFYKTSVSLLYVDTNERASEIFKVGSVRLENNRQENSYYLAKPFLDRLATQAGIQFDPGSGDVTRIDENTWKASAFGAIRLPDTSVRTSGNFKIIDLATEEKKYRLAYEEKAEKGISDYRAAEAAAKEYAGEWVDTGRKNEKGYPVRLYVIAEQERQRYVKKSLLDAMTQLRASAPQKAATGAILRVIRNLLGIKGTYTMDELKKPFAVARSSFSPDYNDPVVRQMLLMQAMQSSGNLFGSTPSVVRTVPIPQPDMNVGTDFPVEVNEPEEVVMGHAAQAAEQEEAQYVQETGRIMTEENRTEDFRCDKCDCVIPEKVWNYSIENMGRPLCYKCQRVVRNDQR